MKASLNHLRVRKSRLYDVVFYAPGIASIVSTHRPLSPGGAETQVLMLAAALARRGARVAIVTYGSACELPLVVDGVDIHVRPRPKRGCGLVGKVRETFLIWRSLWTVPSKTIVFRCAGVDLGVIALYARLARRRLVFASASIMDFDYRELEPNRLYRLVYDLGARLADSIVVQTEEQVAPCQAAFRRRPVVIKSIRPTASPQRGIPLAFLWVGRLVSYKRPLEYVALARALPDAKFWMVGVPTPHQESDRLLARTVLEQARRVPNLEVMSPRPHKELQSLMARAVASVNTGEFEGMPNVLLEAWSRGVPALVLSYDPDGVVRNHDLGLLAHGSREKFATLASELWTTRNNRADISQRCRTYIRTNHAPEIVANQWLRIV
jgi:glycosyltransferase involved in cell wall biosynthesis